MVWLLPKDDKLGPQLRLLNCPTWKALENVFKWPWLDWCESVRAAELWRRGWDWIRKEGNRDNPDGALESSLSVKQSSSGISIERCGVKAGEILKVGRGAERMDVKPCVYNSHIPYQACICLLPPAFCVQTLGGSGVAPMLVFLLLTLKTGTVLT